MRIPGLRRDRGDEAYDQLPSQIICPVCGLRNDSMARFCRNCGLPLGAPRDPVRGTTSGRADLPSEHGAGIAAVVGLLVAVVVLAGAGWLILRSNSGPGTATGPTPTPAGSQAPAASPDPAATLVPAATGGALPSRLPAGSGDPGPSVVPSSPGAATPAPSGEPSAAPTEPPLVADTTFTCDPASFVDPTRGAWRVTAARWGKRGDRFDELTIELTREEGRGRTTIEVEALNARQAARVSGLAEAPTSRVILITFDGDVIIRQAIVADMALEALDYLNVETPDETTYGAVGVNSDGCYRMLVPDWQEGVTTAVGDTVDLLLRVRYD